MDLSTTYLGLKLKNPLVLSASPLTEDIGNIRKMEDPGAAAVVLYSLFEEQITVESKELDRHPVARTRASPSRSPTSPILASYNMGPDGYLEQIAQGQGGGEDSRHRQPERHVAPAAGLGYAKQMEEAGADALELNIYYIPTNADVTGAAGGADVPGPGARGEGEREDSGRREAGPLLQPPWRTWRSGWTRPARTALVLFNRFYQPDFDLETLESGAQPAAEQLLRAADCGCAGWRSCTGHMKADLAITGGVHTADDVLKTMMAGAQVVEMASAVLKRGIDYLKTVESELVAWMEEHEYESIKQMQGSMSQRSVANPNSFLRANYLKVLSSYSLRA